MQPRAQFPAIVAPYSTALQRDAITWKRLIALSFGTLRAQLAQRMKGVWPRPDLFLPPLRLFLVILQEAHRVRTVADLTAA